MEHINYTERVIMETQKTRKTRTRAPQVIKGIGALPDHMRLSEHELANVARLVRALREQDYWVGGFIEWLLAKNCEGATSVGVTIADAEAMLKDIYGLGSWAKWLKTNETERAPMRRYFGHRFFPDRVDQMSQESYTAADNEGFEELVQIWRKEHPKPTCRQKTPSGHLGQMDDDG